MDPKRRHGFGFRFKLILLIPSRCVCSWKLKIKVICFYYSDADYDAEISSPETSFSNPFDECATVAALIVINLLLFNGIIKQK